MDNQQNIFKEAFRQTFRWTRSSSFLMSAFLALLVLIGYVWWPLLSAYISTYNPDLPFWIQMDWLLLGDFLVMSILIMASADIRSDWLMFVVGLAGGLVIESWGTQTNLWFYYTSERPPLWIIPAWPIASLSIDRLFRFIKALSRQIPERVFKISYWFIFSGFLILMIFFVRPTIDKSLTLMALVLCFFLVLTPTNQRAMVLTFVAGSGLGYFLELWGTTRQCWIYYTFATPPFFAVLAHGMAAVAFWRVRELYQVFEPRLKKLLASNAKT